MAAAARAVGHAWTRLVSSTIMGTRSSGGLSSSTMSNTRPISSASSPMSAATSTPTPTAAIAATRPPKHKTPRKRASSILAELKLAEHAKGLAANADKDIPTFRPGDSIEVKMVTHLTSTETDTYRGVVLSVRKNGADTRFTLADVFLGTPILSSIPLYSPFIKSLKVLQAAYIHKGKKRVRRSKLYYLWEKRDPKVFSIST
ncbi:ribosomal protein l19 [Nannochloropsis oceanica]